MQKFNEPVQNTRGDIIALAPAMAMVAGTNTPATVFADAGGLQSITDLRTDNLGQLQFYAPNGRYDIYVVINGQRVGHKLDVLLYDPAETLGGAVPLSKAEAAANTGASLIGAASGKTVQQEIDALHAPASASALGLVKVGSGLTVDQVGVISATGVAAGSVASVNSKTPNAGNVTLTADDIPEAGTPTNKWFTPARVLASVLAGLSTATNAAVTAADTIVAAIGKLQAQINANATAINTNGTAIATKDASDGYPGLTGYALNIKNAAGAILSKIVSAATAARTWTFPDKDGTVAMLSDIPQAGSLVLLGQATVSTAVANIDFLNLFTSSYDKYVIELSNYQPSASQNLAFQVALGGSVSTLSVYSAPQGNGNSTSTTSTSTLIGIGTHNTAQTSHGMTFEINNVNAGVPKAIGVRGIFTNNTGAVEAVIGTAHCGLANVLSGFRLSWAGGGNFTKATVRVYGIKNS